MTCYKRERCGTPWDADAGGYERTEVREALVTCGLSALCFVLALVGGMI
jgi:hypothetical protein